MRRRLRRWLTRPSRIPPPLRITAAILCTAGALMAWSAPPSGASGPAAPAPTPFSRSAHHTGYIVAKPTKRPDTPGAGNPVQTIPDTPAMRAQGFDIFNEDCASCHGMNLEGMKGIAPSLVDVGEGPVLFYVGTGRMPLPAPKDEPLRTTPLFDREQVNAIVDYIATYGGPKAPEADAAAGNLAVGFKLFTEDCAGCHQSLARGGMTVDVPVPSLQKATPDQVAEAVRFGPYLMPHFDEDQIDQSQLNSLARYVVWTRHPKNSGGWGIYNIGPIPEGIAAWFLALVAMVLVARLIGERGERFTQPTIDGEVTR